MLKVKSFLFNAFQENTYVLYDETKACVIIDAGCYDRGEQEELQSFIAEHQLQVKQLLNTHGHVDHVLGNDFVKRTYHTGPYIHPLDEPVLRAVKAYAPNYGFHEYQEVLPEGYLKVGDEVKFGNQKMKILFVPGHAPGHVAFYNEAEKVVIAGDVLFYNSIGRTDLPGGNYETLINSIRQQLFILPDDVTVYPGHGPKTTIGFEKRTNPYCALTPHQS